MIEEKGLGCQYYTAGGTIGLSFRNEQQSAMLDLACFASLEKILSSSPSD